MNNFVSVIESSPFFSAFYGALLSGLIIGGLFYIIFPRVLKSLKKPKLSFLLRKSRGKVFIMSKAIDGNWEGTMHLAIKNDGRETINKYYWHLLIPSDLNPVIVDRISGVGIKPELLEDDWSSFSGNLNDPLFPKRNFIFPYEIKIKISSKNS